MLSNTPVWTIGTGQKAILSDDEWNVYSSDGVTPISISTKMVSRFVPRGLLTESVFGEFFDKIEEMISPFSPFRRRGDGAKLKKLLSEILPLPFEMVDHIMSCLRIGEVRKIKKGELKVDFH